MISASFFNALVKIGKKRAERSTAHSSYYFLLTTFLDNASVLCLACILRSPSPFSCGSSHSATHLSYARFWHGNHYIYAYTSIESFPSVTLGISSLSLFLSLFRLNEHHALQCIKQHLECLPPYLCLAFISNNKKSNTLIFIHPCLFLLSLPFIQK